MGALGQIGQDSGHSFELWLKMTVGGGAQVTAAVCLGASLVLCSIRHYLLFVPLSILHLLAFSHDTLMALSSPTPLNKTKDILCVSNEQLLD